MTIRLNIKETTFQKGSLAKIPWEGRSFDDSQDTRAYLLDKFFEGVCSWKVGDQVEAKIVKEAENGRFIYVVPLDAGAPASKEDVPAPAPVPEPVDDGYGEYVSPITEIVSDVPDDVTLFVAELKQANKVLERSARYYQVSVTKISLRYRAAKMKIQGQMDGWGANTRLIRDMGGNENFIKELENRLSDSGRSMKQLDDDMLGEIHRMAWTFISRDDVQSDLMHVLEAEAMFEQNEFDERTAVSYPFVLWMYSRNEFPNTQNAWKFLNVIEERTINTALGQNTL